MNDVESPIRREVHPWVAEARKGPRFGIAFGAWADGPALAPFVRDVEALGFDSFWGIDHPLSIWGGDCWTTLAALAAVTTRIRLGSLVSCIYYRSPVLLARQAADVDRWSNGRLVLGLGIGDAASEFSRMQIPLPGVRERHAALTETIQILDGLWRQSPFTYEGQHFSVADATLQKGPVQEPHVPILIGGGGERLTLRQVARYADMCNISEHWAAGDARTLDDVRRKLAALRRHCEELGRPYEAILKSHSTLCLVLAKSRSEAQTKLERIPEEFWQISVAGTPSDAIRYYQGLVDAGMQYFTPFVYGNDLETVQLLAERVVPEVGYR